MPTTKGAPTSTKPVVASSASAAEPAPATIPPAEPDEPAAEMRATNGRNDRDDDRGGIARWVRRLLRAAVLVALVVGVGVGIYYGWPIVEDRLIAPVQTNTSDLGALRERIAQLESQVTALGTTDATIQADLAALGDRLADHDRRLAALDEMGTTLAASDEAAARAAVRQIRLLKGMELMSRARLFLYQSNFGLAEQDLEAARAQLADLALGGDVDGEAVVSVAVDRLDRAIDALPEFPVAASDELDIAWQALLGRVPAASATIDPEPTSSAEPASSPTPPPTPAATP